MRHMKEKKLAAGIGSKLGALRKNKILKSKKLICAGALLIIAICAAAAFAIKKKNAESADAMPDGGSVGTVMRGSVSNELSSAGVLAPKNTYSITSLVSGEIIEADFEKGDQVSEGQTLFVIDRSEISSDVESAEREYNNANKDYQDAEIDKSEALSELNNGTVLSSKSGYVKNLSLVSGDSVSDDEKIADLYNDTQMSFRAAFLDSDADSLSVGQDISVELNDTGEQIPGKIKSKSDLTEMLDGGIPVKYVEIYVSNPGGLTENDTANAFTGEIHSIGSGSFKPISTEELKVSLPDTVEADRILVHEGQYVTVGTPLFTITDKSLQDALRKVNKAAEDAENGLISAQNQISKLNDTIDKYTIKAPISGQVISKDMRVGDKVNSSSSTTSQLALIYDLSELSFEMNIDELDISKVKAGQRVVITADAFPDETYSGEVTNVSLKGTAQNGITTYPVSVTLSDYGDLLPGMNVSGLIKLEESDDTLYVPSGALQRGDIVYVSNDSLAADAETAEDSDAPEGYTAVKVTTGIISNDFVEILDGLSEGQQIFVKDTISEDPWDMMYMGGNGYY